MALTALNPALASLDPDALPDDGAGPGDEEAHAVEVRQLQVPMDLHTSRLDKALAELEDNFRYNDAVIRNLVIRRDEAVIDQSEMLKAEENRSERRERRDRPEHADSADGDDSDNSDSDNADE